MSGIGKEVTTSRTQLLRDSRFEVKISLFTENTPFHVMDMGQYTIQVHLAM